MSPGHRRAATFSAGIGSSYGQFFSSAYKYFLEIYDLGSGSLLSSAQGDVGSNGVNFVTAEEELSWVTDRYFYMPLTGEHDKDVAFRFRLGTLESNNDVIG